MARKVRIDYARAAYHVTDPFTFIDLQQALTGTPAETIGEVKRRIADYAPGGGYIAGPSNHFTSDVPVENFFALYRTAREFGTYPYPLPRGNTT